MHLGAPMLSVTGSLEGAVLEVLAGAHTPLPLANVHRLIHSASKSGVRKALLRLAEGGVVQVLPGGYVLNRDHVACDGILRLASLRGELFNRMATEIASWRPAVALAGVYGSAARGDGDEESDIDVLIVADRLPIDALGRLSHLVVRSSGNDCQIVHLTKQGFANAQRAGESIVKVWEEALTVLVGDSTQLFGVNNDGKKGSANRSLRRR
jgi:hypothetical protein